MMVESAMLFGNAPGASSMPIQYRKPRRKAAAARSRCR